MTKTLGLIAEIVMWPVVISLMITTWVITLMLLVRTLGS